MSLEEWGVIAEVIGAVAIVVTLIYLAIQVRHSKESLDANTRAIRGQAITDVTRNIHDQMQMLVQGHDMTEWFESFVSGKPLHAKDALLTDAFLSAVFMARQNEFLQWQQGLLDETVFKSLHHVTRVLLSTKNGEAWWNNEGRTMYGSEFVEFIDALRHESTPDELERFKRALRIQ